MMGEDVLSKIYSNMDNCIYKSKQRYADHTRDWPKPTCLIHDLGHSSYECKVLKYFGTKYEKGRPFMGCRQEPTLEKKFGNKKEVMLLSNTQSMRSPCKKI